MYWLSFIWLLLMCCFVFVCACNFVYVSGLFVCDYGCLYNDLWLLMVCYVGFFLLCFYLVFFWFNCVNVVLVMRCLWRLRYWWWLFLYCCLFIVVVFLIVDLIWLVVCDIVLFVFVWVGFVWFVDCLFLGLIVLDVCFTFEVFWFGFVVCMFMWLF